MHRVGPNLPSGVEIVRHQLVHGDEGPRPPHPGAAVNQQRVCQINCFGLAFSRLPPASVLSSLVRVTRSRRTLVSLGAVRSRHSSVCSCVTSCCPLASVSRSFLKRTTVYLVQLDKDNPPLVKCSLVGRAEELHRDVVGQLERLPLLRPVLVRLELPALLQPGDHHQHSNLR